MIKTAVPTTMDFFDVAIGVSVLVVVFILSLFTGGFSFFTPWIFWAAALLFVAGFSRAPSQEQTLWRRVVSINLSWLILVPAALWRGTLICSPPGWQPTAILGCAAGPNFGWSGISTAGRATR